MYCFGRARSDWTSQAARWDSGGPNLLRLVASRPHSRARTERSLGLEGEGFFLLLLLFLPFFSLRLLGFLGGEIRFGPVGFEYLDHPSDRLRLFTDEADLPATIEFERPKTLAADERGLTVANHRPHMHPVVGQLLYAHPAAAF